MKIVLENAEQVELLVTVLSEKIEQQTRVLGFCKTLNEVTIVNARIESLRRIKNHVFKIKPSKVSP